MPVTALGKTLTFDSTPGQPLQVMFEPGELLANIWLCMVTLMSQLLYSQAVELTGMGLEVQENGKLCYVHTVPRPPDPI